MHDSNILMRHHEYFYAGLKKVMCQQSSLLSSGTSAQPLNSLFFTVFSLYFHCIFTVFSLHFSAKNADRHIILHRSFRAFFHFSLRFTSHHNIHNQFNQKTLCMVLYKLKQTDNTTNLHLSSFCVQPVSTFMYVMDSLLVIMT